MVSTWDETIWELASGQYDVVATWQLVPLGITHQMIRRRVADRRLHRLFAGCMRLDRRACHSMHVGEPPPWPAALTGCSAIAMRPHWVTYRGLATGEST